ncbi:MAG: redox-regulated ATPase YchF [Alphaproteobacteria bacterium]|jgi:ribosome-binding ATPase|nr:redox-regulated ATPase YchF [Alphaproteobacteria bacterium]MBT5390030.1 redox-regulated ATPase YchF [Alphaproteobacteria bacterium]MBT5540469.1 redox-regulated ATPase YchF [Alphaproteobacteria bacterium]MBT5655020.1 redox-regulated ATPase YchF [Alphaproteobacteria bacterium]
MGFNCGIVGLPNVGKSTLFNALTSTASAEAANYPFCTIEPNVGRVGVPDLRLNTLSDIAKSAKTIPTQLEFVDIAGLVRGASKGEGLGNQFLANIREVDALIEIVRCFENNDISHVEGSLDPVRDIEIIETELMLSDMESLERQEASVLKKTRSQGKEAIEAKALHALILRALELLKDGKPARLLDVSPDEEPFLNQLNLLTLKPILYVCNVNEEEASTGNEHSQKVAEHAKKVGARTAIISAAIEAEAAELSTEDRQEYLESLDLKETGLSQVIREGYSLLSLITFFTIGPKEARAWTVQKGSKAPGAAGCIHTDFEKGFIRAETIAYNDFLSLKGEQGAKEAGKLRLEGKDYLVQDGDVFHFRFNV